MEKSFKKILIVGAGYMGYQIARHFAAHQVKVVLFDTNLQTIQRIQKETTGGYLECSTSLEEAAAECDLVIESITENLRVKQDFFKRLEPLVREDTILTTNSSMLLPSKIAKKLNSKHRFCGYHFYAPDLGANIVDVMGIKQTSPQVIDRLYQFSQQNGLEPVHVKKESIGYVYNAILNNINAAAIGLVIKGVSSIEDVDKSFRIVAGTELGPFQMMDIVGLDVVLHIVRNGVVQHPKNLFAIKFLNPYVKAGKLGVKTGEGFYRYT